MDGGLSRTLKAVAAALEVSRFPVGVYQRFVMRETLTNLYEYFVDAEGLASCLVGGNASGRGYVSLLIAQKPCGKLMALRRIYFYTNKICGGKLYYGFFRSGYGVCPEPYNTGEKT
eukprot:TRINITY_DN2618_c0_g4_i4.p1 TRINITY_DN2618_c0_g4~~TRINITY_DN2618_c0_g4_i4.p1  ORF type:complete len:116 (-),score=2.07 TRINITY_DN2618_c0_g4_i4:397-744(-)